VLFGEPISVYHADRVHVGSTQIKLAERSASLFHENCILGQGPDQSSDALTLGRLWHTLRELGNDKFGEFAHLAPPEHCTPTTGGLSTKKETKAWVESLGPDAVVLTPALSDTLGKMWDGFVRNSAAVELEEKVVDREPSLRWESTGGVKVRCRPDAITSDGRLVDYKTTSCAVILKEFPLSVRKYGYGLSAALYEQGCLMAGLAEPPMQFVVTSTVFPFRTQVLTLPPAYMEWARRRLEQVLEDIAARQASGNWDEDGYGMVNELVMPGFGGERVTNWIE
jgi:hypothetical protein